MYSTKEEVNFAGNLDFFAKQVVEGFLTGLHKSPYHGFSVEFAEHRLYNRGDSIKNIPLLIQESIIIKYNIIYNSG